MITVYGIRGNHVARLRAALIQKNLEFQHVSVKLHESKEFEKVNPIGKIPAIKDNDGTIVWDSVHIMEYLEMKYPDTYKMLGDNPKDKAKILNVIALVDKITEMLPPYFWEKVLEKY